MKIQAFTQPRPMPDRVYAKNQDAEYRAHADSYVSERDQVTSQAMRWGFLTTGGATAAVSVSALALAAHLLGMPGEVALVGSGLGVVVLAACAGVAGGTVAADKASRVFDSQHERPVLTVQNWDTYVSPYHSLLTLDDIRH